MNDIVFFFEPFGDEETMVCPVVVEDQHGRPRVLDEWMNLFFEEVEEIFFIGGLRELPVELSTI